MIDNSGSIRDNDPPGGNNWKLILDFVKSIIDVFTVAPDATRFAAIDFGMTQLPQTLLLYRHTNGRQCACESITNQSF